MIFRQLTGAVGAFMGRDNLVRYGGFLMRAGRQDLPNAIAGNGELMVQNVVLRNVGTHESVIIDCGANVGLWSTQLIEVAKKMEVKTSIKLICFEPSSFTYQKLSAALEESQTRMVNAIALQKALSSERGTFDLKIVHAGAGTNSLVTVPGKYSDIEVVEVDTLDEFSDSNRIEHIDLLKIDAEGHDFDVILGAKNLLSQYRIGVVQFEYNWRWIYGKHFLLEVFELIQQWGYSIGKVTPGGVQFYPAYDVQLESFVEGNYLACTEEWRSRFEAVPSWLS